MNAPLLHLLVSRMIFRLAIAFALAGVLVVAPAGAQPPERSSARHGERAALIQGLTKGQEITVEGVRYQHLPELRAVRITKKSNTSQVLGQLGVQAADLVDSHEGLAFVRRPSGRAEAQTETANSHTLYPVVLNTENGQLGLLSGTIIVKPRDLADAEALASTHGLVLLRSYDHLGVAFFTVQKGRELLAAAAGLAADPRVLSAEVEVIEHIRTPK